MAGPLRSILALSIRDPRAGVRAVLSALPERGARQELFLLAAILPTLLIFLVLGLSGDMTLAPAGPLILLLMQVAGLLIVTGLGYVLCRWRGGVGSFSDCLAALAWLQVIMAAVQAALLVVELALPFMGVFAGIATIGLALWLAAHFLAEVHQFKNARVVGFGILGFIFAMFIILGWLTSLAGGAHV
ncbi:Yip1 family protein [Falsirhodobacter sp. 1013]|uniref:Yip1 family protein n=1 Tax=Falsirhodobacter sp. 1013 TaxID=3417566 RepID=UPI003EB8ADBA